MENYEKENNKQNSGVTLSKYVPEYVPEINLSEKDKEALEKTLDKLGALLDKSLSTLDYLKNTKK